ncbi:MULTISPECIES: 16S rRNA (cytosine(1402)-N(4))-methyltransferase RsmH [Ralstonia solanacearum species complex]|uniref:Ribosomal RNA small subunit methyltransferase H n=2 Tax=Ralstonia syzygii TaxID=28097 RepID=G3A1R5_9RALS|nr:MULTISPECIES: 16S rRNA (cytosine(1402)-N(4))-methyltransferase RsmH [Ralstonia solanacearum species complex]BEU70972.1 16S rRNA (cytosine(1402)-N(4))-methyltransferase RsmH [Ralstonia pseudosolanacearum]AMP36545.1 16S rRNA (cytosine(1402)-N(4))-methyltransferase [Ralstonia solanacearum]AXV75976.1 16S rRNA (cytosine(1402)-N(4))-methyltransferase RsmH [Ralstonia solanacearum]AXV85342.1 16S rRNA (cytosine(1402)-N(4))-methyltransferase RsmH [Ralstonia solanacearum]AXV89979.1 16S rRNA (cytosine(
MTTQANTGLRHQTVLRDEAVDALLWRDDGIYIDGTFGRGGHSRLILERLGPGGRLIAFDKDPAAITEAGTVEDARFAIEHDSFAHLDAALDARGIGRVAGVLLDLGISSPQIDEGARGFSFRMDGPLDMRMDTTRGITAAQWLAEADARDIARVIRDYGEERFAVQIAKAIVARRSESGTRGPLDRTSELAALVAQAVKTREKGQDPATRTFQALRIHVNQELADLETGLKAAFERLEQGGRLVVISFHSLEDRIVKRFMQALARPEQSAAPEMRRAPLRAHELPAPQLRLLGRVRPSEAEVSANPRARSAIMRVAERC